MFTVIVNENEQFWNKIAFRLAVLYLGDEWNEKTLKRRRAVSIARFSENFAHRMTIQSANYAGWRYVVSRIWVPVQPARSACRCFAERSRWLETFRHVSHIRSCRTPPGDWLCDNRHLYALATNTPLERRDSAFLPIIYVHVLYVMYVMYVISTNMHIIYIYIYIKIYIIHIYNNNPALYMYTHIM